MGNEHKAYFDAYLCYIFQKALIYLGLFIPIANTDYSGGYFTVKRSVSADFTHLDDKLLINTN